MDYANLITIAYEFTYTCLNCVNLEWLYSIVSDLAHHSALSARYRSRFVDTAVPDVSALPTTDASPTLCIAIVSSTR